MVLYVVHWVYGEFNQYKVFLGVFDNREKATQEVCEDFIADEIVITECTLNEYPH